MHNNTIRSRNRKIINEGGCVMNFRSWFLKCIYLSSILFLFSSFECFTLSVTDTSVIWTPYYLSQLHPFPKRVKYAFERQMLKVSEVERLPDGCQAVITIIILSFIQTYFTLFFFYFFSFFLFWQDFCRVSS